MAYEAVCTCDLCNTTIGSGDEVYCEPCIAALQKQVTALEETVDKKDGKIDVLEDRLNELEEQVETLLETPVLDRVLFRERFGEKKK